MKKSLKKNQSVITGLVVMVAFAGYFGMRNGTELPVATSSEEVNAVTDISDEDLVLDEGDADAVSGAASTASRENAGEAVMVSSSVSGSYFEEAKLAREQTRAKNKETLTAIVNNKNATEAQKDDAMKEIMRMTTAGEKETATETMLEAKGFADAVVTIQNDSVDVVVDGEKLTEQQIAQIESVVKRKTGCSSDKIVISPVGKNK